LAAQNGPKQGKTTAEASTQHFFQKRFATTTPGETGTENAKVAGSTPALTTKRNPGIFLGLRFFCAPRLTAGLDVVR